MRSILLGVLLVATACGGSEEVEERQSPRRASSQGQPLVVISTAGGLIGGVSELVLDEIGTLYLVDRQASQIHVVDSTGTVTSFGRPGAGPGEFSQPTTLQRRGDTLFVVDWGNLRMQGLTVTGVLLFSRVLPPGQAPSIGADGRFVRPTWGIDTMLAVIHAPDLSVVAPIGRTVGALTNTVRPARMKQEIREGKVPAVFLNTAQAVVAPDSAVWLYVPARGSVQRFDAQGREVFSFALDEPDQQVVFDRFVSENAVKPQGSFALLQYIADATIVGEDLWVLLGTSVTGPASVRILHPNGTLGERLEFPNVVGASQLAVDDARRVAYFLKGDLAELVRVAF